MKGTADKPFITTLKEKCRVCYTCVRECPSKAIRIADGQAEVVPERCIGCGNCVRVCSQHAKQAASSIDRVRKLFTNNHTVTACIAPSFPAEFPEVDYRELVGMIRKLGFAAVHEVAFGADLVAHEYTRLLAENPDKRFIATSCPGVVGYVERYEPEMVDHLAPIVSPMVACARVMHRIHGDDAKVVFLGPCIAKKVESASANLPDDVDEALTFVELRQMFVAAGITPESVEPVEFDGPYPNLGALFPITRGMLQAADIEEDLMSGNVVSAAGRQSFVEAIREFASGDMEARLLEVLCCDGCIMGAGMSSQAPLFSRRGKVSEYVRKRMHEIDKAQWKAELERFADIDLARNYTVNDQRIPAPRE
ncbi:MAG: [Fe-Fe] hydrogenase large subunit C-terminal domain-containing protein, partial [Planctomycetota bacterium]